jgi:hypothetical protein
MLNIEHLSETLFANFDLFLIKNHFKNFYYDNASLEKIWNDKIATYTKEQVPNTYKSADITHNATIKVPSSYDIMNL